jgi:hypothetical protein
LNKSGRDDEFKDAKDEDKEKKDKIIWFPRETKHFWRKEALDLRKCFKFAGPPHLIFLFFDIYMYEFEIPAIIFDVVMIYANFYNFRTMTKATIGAECVAYLIGTFVSLTHLKRVLYEAEWWLTTICFFVQFIFFYPLAAATIGKKLRDHHEQ